MYTFWAFVAAACLSLVIYGYRPVWQWRLRHIPGPSPSWFLGGASKMQGLGAMTYPQELGQIYGPVFKIWGLLGPSVVVISPTLARNVLVHNSARPRFPIRDTSSKKSVEFDAASILTSSGDRHKSVRSAWSPMFFTGSLEGFTDLMGNAAAMLCQRLGGTADTGHVVDIWRWLGDMTMDVVGTAAFGVDFRTQVPESMLDHKDAQCTQQLRNDVATFFRGMGGMSSIWMLMLVLFPEAGPLIRWLSSRFPDSNMRPSRQARARLIQLTSDLVAQHRAKLRQNSTNGHSPVEDSPMAFPLKVNRRELPESKEEIRKGVHPGSFIDLLVRGVDRSTSQKFSDVQIASQAFTMIAAGYETTANMLAFTIYNLARCPEKAAKLCAEIDATSKGTSLDQLPYTDAVLHESLRLFPPIPLTSRAAARDQLIGGYKVPKGQSVLVSIWALQRDESLWSDAEAFKPERWLNGNLEPHAWKAFGDGPRNCPGQRFALKEAKIALYHIFSHYMFRLGPGMDPLPLRNALTMSPRDGVQVTVHRRR